MTQDIKITIEGANKSGKTTIARLIQKVLDNHSIYASYSDPDTGQPSVWIDEDKVRAALKTLSDRGIMVDIEEKRTPRTLKHTP